MIEFLAVLLMLGILSVLILVHELGHFSVARFFGFQTPVFGFGLPFGPHWVVGRKWGTEFRIHACLLGGYVAIPELGDESNEEAFGIPLKPFRKFPIWQRALVAAAGVAMNIAFAYVIMVAMLGFIGEPSQPVVVHSLIASNPIAAKAGIQAKDQVLSIDNVKVTSPSEAVNFLVSHKSTKVVVKVARNNQILDIPMTTNQDGKVGMALVPQGDVHYQSVDANFFQLLGISAVKLWNLTGSMVSAIGQMLSGLFTVHKGEGGPSLGIQDLHGVLAVIALGSDICQQEWRQLPLFTILISMDLALINLIPWPALDGGHLAFMAFEGLRGRPMEEKAQGEIVKWGFISLLLLMAVVMVNDITALFSGKLNLKPKQKSAPVSAPAPQKP